LLNPIYNSTWDKALTTLREKTPENSIINTWWPPGHFIKTTAKRRVTFDGATINVPQAYWLANFFLSQDENEALGILRMLNNSGNEAVEYLEDSGFNLSTSVNIIKDVVKRKRPESKELLKKIFKNIYQVEHLLDLTHRSADPSYILLYNEFVDNNIQLSFIGHWDFKKIEEINSDPERLKNIPKPNSREYIDFLWDLAGGSLKYSGLLTQISRDANTILFQDNIKIDLDTMKTLISSKKYGTGVPYSIFYLHEGKVIEKISQASNLPYSVVLSASNGRYNCLLLDRALAKSMLVQLYFFNSKGLKYFEPLEEVSDLTGRTVIKTYKVNWESFQP